LGYSFDRPERVAKRPPPLGVRMNKKVCELLEFLGVETMSVDYSPLGSCEDRAFASIIAGVIQ
jgi:hypothetical protein